MIVKSHAKINVSLKVLGVRDDGFHELEMVNLPLELHDAIEISFLPENEDTFITCDELRLASLKSNICQKAADLMREHYHIKKNFRIHIHKEVPFAAGLGGGSSNAAAVIKAINVMAKLNRPDEELAEIGGELGADVPFFILNRPAKVMGRGEKMEFLDGMHSYLCLIVKPIEGLSTKDVYAICDKFPRQRIDTERVIEGLRSGDLNEVAEYAGNDLMPAAESMMPEVGDIYAMMKKDGFEAVCMSGSGSSVYGLTKDMHRWKSCAHKYEKKGYIVCPTKTLK